MTPQNDKLKSIIEEFGEKSSEFQQTLLEIAEGKYPIERWNNVMGELCIFEQSFLLSKLTEYGASERATGREEAIKEAIKLIGNKANDLPMRDYFYSGLMTAQAFLLFLQKTSQEETPT